MPPCPECATIRDGEIIRRSSSVSKQRVKALSISRPVFDMVRKDGLTGRVLGNYRRACNLVTSEQEIIALVSPMIGNGPLNIVIEENVALEHVEPESPAVLSNSQLVLGDSLVVLLGGAKLWRPEVNWGCLTNQRRKLEDSLTALCTWLCQDNGTKLALRGLSDPHDGTRSLQNRAFLTTAWMGIKGLLQALQHGDRSGIRENATLLAGLGPGLTPAGDDYLVGLMAGLRVWPGPLERCGLSPEEVCQIILEATEGKTTLLSSAFLHSAQKGMFGEDWHELLAELARGEATGIQRAAKRILSSGATSGADALAGFLSPYLWQRRLAGKHKPCYNPQ